MKVRGDFLGPPRSTDKTTLIIKVSKGAKIRNRYNQVPHLTQDTNGKVTNSQKTPQTRANNSALPDDSPTNLYVHNLTMAIYIQYKFHEILSIGYLVMCLVHISCII